MEIEPLWALREGAEMTLPRDIEFCPHCEDYHQPVPVSLEQTYTIRDWSTTITVHTTACSRCGKEIGSDEIDDRTLTAVYAEYRRQIGGKEE